MCITCAFYGERRSLERENFLKVVLYLQGVVAVFLHYKAYFLIIKMEESK